MPLPILNIVIQNGVGAKRRSPLSYSFWVKKDDNDETVDVDHSYIGDEYKGLINVFMSRLRDVNFHLTKFDSGKRVLTNIVNIYLEKQKILMCMTDCLISRNPLKICHILTIKYIGS